MNLHRFASSLLSTLILGLFAFRYPLQASEWDTQYWQFVNWKNWESGPFKYYTSAEFRFSGDVRKFTYYRIAANVAYQVNKNLSLEAHNSWEWEIPVRTRRIVNADRVELEINPSLPLCYGATLKWRNRFEFLKKQGNPKVQYIFRHLAKATLPVQGFAHLKAINCFEEIFYDFNKGRVSQNRFAPIDLSFELKPELNLDVFLMIRNLFVSRFNAWHNSIVFGSEIGF